VNEWIQAWASSGLGVVRPLRVCRALLGTRAFNSLSSTFFSSALSSPSMHVGKLKARPASASEEVPPVSPFCSPLIWLTLIKRVSMCTQPSRSAGMFYRRLHVTPNQSAAASSNGSDGYDAKHHTESEPAPQRPPATVLEEHTYGRRRIYSRAPTASSAPPSPTNASSSASGSGSAAGDERQKHAPLQWDWLYEQNGSRWSTNRYAQRALSWLRAMFLPIKYPESVHPCYLKFHLWQVGACLPLCCAAPAFTSRCACCWDRCA
jgi:hypothetical protein